MSRLAGLAVAVLLGCGAGFGAETCTTQSQMQPAERDALAGAARALAVEMQAGDLAAVKAGTIADFQKDFSGMANAVQGTAPRLKGATPEVEQIYVLDSSPDGKAGGASADAQFFCTLNQSQSAAEFSIPQLPPGRYGFAMVRMDGSGGAWRLSYLLRQEGGRWLLAGFYPKPLTAAGHDGLWYWKQARTLYGSSAGNGSSAGAVKEPWNAWLYYQQAQALLQPASFVASTHLDKLQTELAAAAPAAVAGGISAESPLVVKGADGSEYRFTSLGVDDSLGRDKVDVAARLKVEALGDAATARKRNLDATAALLAAHPELRKAFHGVWIFADAPGQSPYATELAMGEVK